MRSNFHFKTDAAYLRTGLPHFGAMPQEFVGVWRAFKNEAYDLDVTVKVKLYTAQQHRESLTYPPLLPSKRRCLMGPADVPEPPPPLRPSKRETAPLHAYKNPPPPPPTPRATTIKAEPGTTTKSDTPPRGHFVKTELGDNTVSQNAPFAASIHHAALPDHGHFRQPLPPPAAPCRHAAAELETPQYQTKASPPPCVLFLAILISS